MIPASSLSSAASAAAAALAEAAAASAQGADAVPDGARTAKTRASRPPSEGVVEKGAPADPAKALPGLTRAARSKSSAPTPRSSAPGYAPSSKTASSKATTSKTPTSKTPTSKTSTSKTSTSKATTSKTPTTLAFLEDPKLSLDDKLIKLLAYLNAGWDAQLQDKLERIGAAEGTKTSSTSGASGSKKKGGILDGLAGAFSSALGGVSGVVDILKNPTVKAALKKLGGPVLAAAASALGFPAAAPALLKYGPTIVDAAVGVASAATKASTKTSSSSSGSGTSASGALSDSDRQGLFMEIQHIREKQQQMFTLVSNILKSGHDTRMSIIGNIR